MKHDGRQPQADQPTPTKQQAQPWTEDDSRKLRELALTHTPVPAIALALGRTEDELRSKAEAAGITLGTTDRAPTGHNGNPGPPPG